MTNTQTVSICSQCEQLNRVDLERSRNQAPVCGKCKAALPFHSGVTEVSGSALGTLAKKSPLPVIVDFWAPWCGPCRAFSPVFEQAAERLAGRAILVKLNTEQHVLASDTYGIRGVPTLLVLASGVERARISGALPLPSFLQWVDQSIGPSGAAA